MTEYVKYAGFSLVIDENRNQSAHFHVSNNRKYALWSDLPEKVRGPGHKVTFHWFKMPPRTTKVEAIGLMQRKAKSEVPASSGKVVQMVLGQKLARLEARQAAPTKAAA